MIKAMQQHVGSWAVERLLVQNPCATLSDLPLVERVGEGGALRDSGFAITGLAASGGSLTDGQVRRSARSA